MQCIAGKRASYREASESREIARRNLGRSSDTTRRTRRARGHGSNSTWRCGRRRRGLTRCRAEPAEEIAQRRPVVLRWPKLQRLLRLLRLLRLPLLLQRLLRRRE